jgi:hypothetical protein
MWHAEITRRRFLEICMGDTVDARVVATPSLQVQFNVAPGVVHAYWPDAPSLLDQLPVLAIVNDDELLSTLTAVMASPLAPSPLTAFCRIISAGEARVHFEQSTIEPQEIAYASIAALAITETMLLSIGKMSIQSASPAACKRTFSYAWGKTIANAGAGESLVGLLPRWLKTYEMIHSQSALDLRTLISSIVRMLTVVTQVSTGMRADGRAGALASSLIKADSGEQEIAWARLSKGVGLDVSLDALSSATREERGTFLQAALRYTANHNDDDTGIAACAFLATRVAPGSLEHMDLLNTIGGANVVLWYTLFSVLQAPQAILGSQGGLGLRIARDLMAREEHASRPVADISFNELAALDRIGFETISKRLGHSNEIQVEILPFVTTSFTFPSKQSRLRASEEVVQIPMEGLSLPPTRENLSMEAKIDVALALLNEVRGQLMPIEPNGRGGLNKKSRRK